MSERGSDLQRAALALGRARARILALERGRAPPVAITGIGLRLPGDIDDLDGLWAALCDRRDLTGPVPEDRREELAGIDAGGPGAGHGGWLGGVDRFAAARFGISAREAALIDPQQRILLEVALAAIEGAALREEALVGSRTGVYVGLCNSDYAQRLLREPGDPRVDATLGTGNAPSMAAGRLAYAFGLQGPAFSIDAACASSLLAVHLGVQAIRSGECERALVGGVNLVLAPNPSLAFARMGVLSPRGRGRAMDASADGYVRAEGCVMMVLEGLAEAEAAGRPILAVIHGSAVRQNGTGNGLVAPNPGAQEAVIRAALRDAAIEADDVGLVAAFGGGTALGDLAEVTALGRVFAGRTRPLWLGLVKPNVGHGEGAAGATSLALACAALDRAAIPPALGEDGPSPRLPWAATRLAAVRTPWEDPRRLAGVSAFGFCGTNVHMIVGAYAAPAATATSTSTHARGDARTIPLSARSEPLLRAYAGALAAHLGAHPELGLDAIAATLADGRTREPVSATIVARDRAGLIAALDRLAVDGAVDRGSTDRDDPHAPRIGGDGAVTDSPASTIGAPTSGGARVRMVPLPPRPLDRQRYWTALGASARPLIGAALPDLDLLRAAPREAREAAITRALTRLLGAALGRELAGGDAFAALGVDSLLVVELLARIREAWGLTVFPGELLARPTLAEFAAHLSDALAPVDPATAASRIEVERALAIGLRRGRPAPAVDEAPADLSLPPPIFLLSTPRSGSTLLRAMLGAHPSLFAPPELHLLAFADVGDWREALAPDLLHLGLHQALAGLGAGEDTIEAEVQGWADRRRSIAAAYDLLRRRAAPRILVDKSPSYALDPAILARAERLFPGARYLHLVRHPVPTSRSFVDRRMGELLGLGDHGGAAAAAQVWTIGNQNLLERLRAVDPRRVLRVRYEALVRDPPAELAGICDFLGLEFAPAMLDPHARRFPGEERGVLGDPGFYARAGVDASLADRWRDEDVPKDMSEETASLGARLGYAIDDPGAAEALSIALDPAITPADRRPPRRPPARILLTGATGFLGPWILRALVDRGDAEVVALIRADDDEAASARLRTALAGAPGLDLGRVRAVAGHLDRPRFGLDAGAWEALADGVDLVIHNGAAVHFAQSWAALAAVNVGGTAEALRLACAGRPKVFVQVSTKGVFDPAVYPGDAPIGEDAPLRPPEGPLLAYQRSKWAAESLVRQAGARGLPIVVCRPGRISGDQASGGLPDADFMVVFLRGCHEIGALPALEFAIEASPVDVVADAIVAIAGREESRGRTFHLTHPRPIDLREVATIAAELGVDLEVLPYDAWRERLLARARGPGSALAPLLSMFPAHEPARIDERRLAHDNTAAALEGSAIRWPPMPALIRASLEFMRARGLLGDR